LKNSHTTLDAFNRLKHLLQFPRLKKLSLSFCETKELPSRGKEIRNLVDFLLTGSKINYLKVSCANLMSFFTENDLRELRTKFPNCIIILKTKLSGKSGEKISDT
jgi:hypothetical protein